MKGKFSEWFIGVTFALVGAMLIVIGISNSISTSDFKERAEQTTATVTRVNEHMMAASGIVFGGIGIGMIFYKFHKADEKDRLLQTGEKIYANFRDVTLNYSYSVNRRNPYIIICTGKDDVTGEGRTFKSENLWDNPEYIIKEKI